MELSNIFYERDDKMLKSLNEILLGDKCVVKKIDDKCNIKRRLLDIGLIPGTITECVLKSPLNDPKAYYVRGGIIAIRDSDAQNILVEDTHE